MELSGVGGRVVKSTGQKMVLLLLLNFAVVLKRKSNLTVIFTINTQ